MPHRSFSDLFEYRIVDGLKTYDPPDVPNPSGAKSVRIEHETAKIDMTQMLIIGRDLNLAQYNKNQKVLRLIFQTP